jgi:hypothetical protein
VQGAAHTRCMPTPADPGELLAEIKRTATMLRDARSVLRRIDTLAAAARAADDPSRPLIDEVRSAAERLVSSLTRRQHMEQCGMKQAARRLR